MKGDMIRQFTVLSFDGLETSVMRTAPAPEPARGQVVLAMEHVAVTFVDALTARGGYQVKPPLPFVPGTSGVGRVVEVGERVGWATVGDRLAVQAPQGLLAEQVAVSDEMAVRVPGGLSGATIAASIEGWATSYFALERRAVIAPGQTVLVLGAGGGVGTAAVNIAADAQARVIAAASTPDKRNAAAWHGASHVVDSADLTAQVRALAPGGVDIVLDPVGGEQGLQALKLLARWGRYCVLGFASGDIPRLGANRILIDNHTVVGVDYGDASRGDAALARDVLEQVLDGFAAGRYRARTPTAMPFAQAVLAFERAAKGASSARTVLSFPGNDSDLRDIAPPAEM
ncbi:putative Alcohol dehydrogenase zinc-binding domain protein [metagenome]|uniref:Putative Alcohol dehydrogenase zinc-binding domain protein n=1 Tax=metagenome TaxID=256318 RepID=A0A2P2CBQ2_9ZZZZ